MKPARREPNPPRGFGCALQEVNTEGTHFFCETADVTSPFPSAAVHGPCLEFVWNHWLASPFHELGLPNHCVVRPRRLYRAMCLTRIGRIGIRVGESDARPIPFTWI
jgi:hypothetical protein